MIGQKNINNVGAPKVNKVIKVNVIQKKESDIKLQTTQNNLVLELFLTGFYMKNLGYSALNTARS